MQFITMQTLAISASILEEPQYHHLPCLWSGKLILEPGGESAMDLPWTSHPALTLLNPLALPVVILSFLFLHLLPVEWRHSTRGDPNYHRCHFPHDQLGLEIKAIARQMLRHWHLFSKSLALEATGTASKTFWEALGNAFLPSIHLNSS